MVTGMHSRFFLELSTVHTMCLTMLVLISACSCHIVSAPAHHSVLKCCQLLRCIPRTCITLALCTQEKTMHYLISISTSFYPACNSVNFVCFQPAFALVNTVCQAYSLHVLLSFVQTLQTWLLKHLISLYWMGMLLKSPAQGPVGI